MPLSLDERCARNDLYKRQRHQETSDAMASLAVAAGCDHTLSQADILATAIKQMQDAGHTSKEVSDMKYINAKLMEQIEILEQRNNDEKIENDNSNKKKTQD